MLPRTKCHTSNSLSTNTSRASCAATVHPVRGPGLLGLPGHLLNCVSVEGMVGKLSCTDRVCLVDCTLSVQNCFHKTLSSDMFVGVLRAD